MKGIYIDEGESYYSDIKPILLAIHNEIKDYNWIITGHECYPKKEENINFLQQKYCWISTEGLIRLLENEQSVTYRLSDKQMKKTKVRKNGLQWIWGYFFGFPNEITKEQALSYGEFYVDGNERIWENPLVIEHPLAMIAIIAFDGCATAVIAEDEKLIEKIKNEYSYAKDLEEYNEEI